MAIEQVPVTGTTTALSIGLSLLTIGLIVGAAKFRPSLNEKWKTGLDATGYVLRSLGGFLSLYGLLATNSTAFWIVCISLIVSLVLLGVIWFFAPQDRPPNSDKDSEAEAEVDANEPKVENGR